MFFVASPCFARLIQPLEFPILRDVQHLIEHDYISSSLDRKQMEYEAIQGYLKQLNDPYTKFLPPKNYRHLQERMRGGYVGIGVHIGLKENRLLVVSPIIGSPADRAGLLAGDFITAVDGKSTTGFSISDAVAHIRGPKGSTVNLSIARQVTHNFNVAIVRDQISVSSIDQRKLLDDRIGYIRLLSFESQNTVTDLVSAIRWLEARGMQSLLLDLRNNGGGLLQNALNAADLFLSGGIVVHTLDRSQRRVSYAATSSVLYPEKPLMILVNEGSASASEILAGAIKDNHRGLVVGRKTFGKASVQRVVGFDDGSALKFTISKYLTPNGTDISTHGVTVNIVIDAEGDVALTEAIRLMKVNLVSD